MARRRTAPANPLEVAIAQGLIWLFFGLLIICNEFPLGAAISEASFSLLRDSGFLLAIAATFLPVPLFWRFARSVYRRGLANHLSDATYTASDCMRGSLIPKLMPLWPIFGTVFFANLVGEGIAFSDSSFSLLRDADFIVAVSVTFIPLPVFSAVLYRDWLKNGSAYTAAMNKHRTAFHEAGHAAACIALGGQAGPVQICDRPKCWVKIADITDPRSGSAGV